VLAVKSVIMGNAFAPARKRFVALPALTPILTAKIAELVCASGQTCDNGKCVCTGKETLCSSTCVDTNSDSQNCGACGNAVLTKLVKVEYVPKPVPMV
ncbi:271_t:CDS:2, partial [Acaulospora colombiana]